MDAKHTGSMIFGGGIVAALLGLSASAAALTASATLQSTVVQVQGSGASPGHAVYWEGMWGANASATGAFAFSSGNVPDDCIGDVTSDLAKIAVAVQGCQPFSPQLALCQGNLNTCTTSLNT